MYEIQQQQVKAHQLTRTWYIPTPMFLGSILISSANGSCNLRAMDTIDNKTQKQHAYYKLCTNIEICKHSTFQATLAFSHLYDRRRT